ncbi:NAD-binding protein [Methanobrevibacter sp.]|uniref:NAD-binding protein n=1 Tax=Methanobrevibacter sp. TaxID=66852 RepID=UPI0025CDD8C9|nr:NAD-binding protein [Methanobrevibacter sp.]MBR4447334.1 NAD-binding protein [Methanobrevibacter sp.]
MRKIILKILTRLPTKYISNGLILIIILFIYGIVGSYFIMGLNLIDSIYYSVITMATVGYGDYTPHTGIQKIFATTLALGGVALLAYVFNIILANFQEKMRKFSKGARTLKAINEMEDYYIICGFGRVGKVVFDELMQRNQNVIVIDKDKEICDSIEESDRVVVINDDAIEDDLVAKLAGEKCRSVIICTGDDVDNLFIVLTIRETNPDAWIVSRASKLDNVKRLKKAGADKIVSPEIIGGQDLYYESVKPHVLRITVKHTVDEIYDEFKIISDNGCTLESIEYHIPGIETPFTRKIKTMNLLDGQKYVNYLNTHDDQRQALNNLYKTVNNIHSHLISGPDKSTFNKLLKELEKQEEIIGIDLTNKEIAEITAKEIK